MTEAQPFALLLNDIHAEKENLLEFSNNWNEALDVCNAYGIKKILIGGDLFTSRASQTLDTMLTVRKCLVAAVDKNIEIYIVPGNHDLVDQEDDDSYCDLYKDLDNVFVGSEHTIYGRDVRVHMMRYWPENGSAIGHIAELSRNLDHSTNNYLYCHFGISGFLKNPSSDELPVSVFEEFDKVLVGHYHDRAKFQNIEYIGSSRQHSFGEDEEKGYTVLFDDGSMEFKKNEVNTRFITIDVPYEKLIHAKKGYEKYFEDARYRIRLRIHTDKNSPNIEKDELLANGFSKVEVINEALQINDTTEQTLEAKYDKNSIKEEYVAFCQQEGSNPELGLEYLEKIN